MYGEVSAALAARVEAVAPALRAALLSEELAFDPQPAPCAGISLASEPSVTVSISHTTRTTQERVSVNVHLWTETADDLEDYSNLVARALSEYRTAGEGWTLQLRSFSERGAEFRDTQRLSGVFFESEIQASGDLYVQRERASEVVAMSPTIKVVGASHGRTTGTVVKGSAGYPAATSGADDVLGIVEAHTSCYFVRTAGQVVTWTHGQAQGVRLYVTAGGVLPLSSIASGTLARSVALTMSATTALVSIGEAFEK